MVCLIDDEYSRREAHGGFAWQSMPSDVWAQQLRDLGKGN